MSSDDGYILRRNEDGEFCLQVYFASAEEYPPIDKASMRFTSLEEAILKYEELDSGDFGSEYGLSVKISSGPRKGVMTVAEMIEELKTYNQLAEVLVDQGLCKPAGVTLLNGDPTKVLITSRR